MVAIHAPVEKTKVYTPVWLAARVSAQSGLGRRTYRRFKIVDLSPLWPESQLRQMAMRWAPKFIHDMELQGYGLLSAEAGVVITGPLPSRDLSGAVSGAQRAKRHVLTGPTLARRPVDIDTRKVGTGAFAKQSGLEDWIIEAQFLGTRIVMIEHRIKADIEE